MNTFVFQVSGHIRKPSFLKGLGLLENLRFRDSESNKQLKQRLLLKHFSEPADPIELFT